LPTASGRETRRYVTSLVRERRRLAVGTVVVLVAATVAGLAVPPLLGRIVDVVVDGRPASDVDVLVVGLLVATVAQGVLSGWGLLLVARLGEVVLAGLREQVVERALTVPLEDVERAGTGDLVARVGGDVDAVSEATREAFPELVISGLTIGLTVVGLAALDWRLALAGLVAVPLQAAGTRWYLRRSRPIYAAERIAEGDRAQQLHASIAGATTVRAYRLQERHLDLVTRRSTAALDLSLRAGSVRARFFSWLNAAELLGLGTILLVGFLLVRSGAVSVGQATAAALYFHRLFDPIGAVLMLVDTAQQATAALARLVGVASLPRQGEPAAGLAPDDASVELRRVRFAYGDGPEVVRDVDLSLVPGTQVALVGASGAGKSTVGKLVAGLHRPTAGHVRFGGIDVGGSGAGSGRRAVTLVTQEVHVFAGTLADDLRLARPDASDDELLAVLSLVGAWQWVDALADGLATVVGDGGHRLTTTQAQQLALARLVLSDPAVAVLDEATAEAGSVGARQLEASARAALEGRTGLVIAHRLTQAAAADEVVVLDRGRVVEQGTHDELRQREGLYAQLWSAWSTSR
jgi:ATP-binding cassette subfamily C protein